MGNFSDGRSEIIVKWHGVAERLTAQAGTDLGLMPTSMAEALHATAHTESNDGNADETSLAEPSWQDWWEKREGLATRAISVQDLAEISLTRLAQANTATNACVDLLREFAMGQARQLDQRLAAGDALGLLGGMPLAHKDLVHRTGHHVGYGLGQSAQLKATSDATVLRRFDEAGALHLARLQMTELAFDPSGANEMAGHCRNPWSVHRIPGGSSSGSAAMVAAGAVDGALGSDTGGSIRIPAALCGVTGLKPTYGLVSRAGAMSLSSSLDHLGPIARSARDCALMLQAIAGYDIADAGSVGAPRNDRYIDRLDASIRGRRIGVPQGYFSDGLDPRIQAVVAQSLESFRTLGVEIREVPDFPYDALNELAILMIRAEATSLYESVMSEDASTMLGAFTRARLQEGTQIPASLYLRAATMRGPLLQRFAHTVMADVDVLLAPVFPSQTPCVDVFDTISDESSRLRGDLTRLTRPLNYLGVPSLSLPGGACVPDGESVALPVGFQLIGRPYSEALLLQLGHAYQKATTWHLRKPPLAA